MKIEKLICFSQFQKAQNIHFFSHTKQHNDEFITCQCSLTREHFIFLFKNFTFVCEKCCVNYLMSFCSVQWHESSSLLVLEQIFKMDLNNGDKMKLGPFMDVVAVLAIHGSHMPLHMGPHSAHNTCTCVNNRLYFCSSLMLSNIFQNIKNKSMLGI